MSDFKEGIPGPSSKSPPPIPSASNSAIEALHTASIQDELASYLFPDIITDTINSATATMKLQLAKILSESSEKPVKDSVVSTTKPAGAADRSAFYDALVTRIMNSPPGVVFITAQMTILMKDLKNHEGTIILHGKFNTAIKAYNGHLDKHSITKMFYAYTAWVDHESPPFRILKQWAMAKVLLHHPEMAAKFKDEAAKSGSRRWEPEKTEDKNTDGKRVDEKKKQGILKYYDSGYEGLCSWIDGIALDPAAIMSSILMMCDMDDDQAGQNEYSLRETLALMAHQLEHNYKELCKTHPMYEIVAKPEEEVAVSKHGRPVRERRTTELNL